VTIVEVVVALGILTLSGGMIYSKMLELGHQSRLIEQSVRRDMLAQQYLAEALACDYAALAAWGGDAALRPIGGDAGASPVAGGQPLARRVTVEKRADGLLAVRATAGRIGADDPNVFEERSTFTLEGIKAP
jgi:hypothetical protein